MAKAHPFGWAFCLQGNIYIFKDAQNTLIFGFWFLVGGRTSAIHQNQKIGLPKGA
jgi:hypothetical protein